MGFDSKSCSDPFIHPPSMQRKCKYWNPTTLLEIVNPNKGYLTCVGYASSCGRRCYNQINQRHRETAFLVLDALSYIDVPTMDVIAMLYQLAGLTLCLRYHQGQRLNVVEKWIEQIDRWHKFKDLSESQIHVHPTTKEPNIGTSSPPKNQFYQKQDKSPPHSFQEERNQKQQGEAARIFKEQERGLLRQEREKREQKETSRDAHKEEEEQKKREEQDRRKKEQEAQEKEDGHEPIRQKAEKARKERERIAKQQAEEEREEWDKIWLRYVLRWDEIKKNGAKGTSKKLQEIIPWPVKLGKYEDVSGFAVEEFFQKAPPQDVDAKKMFVLMKMECLKWHANRVPRMFGILEDKNCLNLFNTVARL